MKPRFIDVGITNLNVIKIKKIDQSYLDSPLHFHSHCELVWIQEGTGKRIVGDRVTNFGPGDLVLLGTNLPHIWKNDEGEDCRVRATVIYFPTNFLLHITDEQSILKPTQDLVKKASRGLWFYGKTLRKISQIMAVIADDNGLKKIIQFLQIVETLVKTKEYDYLASVSFKNETDKNEVGRINNIYQYLMKNFQRDITLKEIAGIANMTTNAFCRFFKGHTQKSLTRFLHELRIGHACKLLQNEKYTIAEVCYESGFNNLVNFNKFFKTITQQTPSAYRKAVLKELS